MNISERIAELTQQQQVLMQRQQEDGVTIQRILGAIAILNEQLNEQTPEQAAPVLEEVPEQASPNGKVVEEEVKA